MTGNNIADEYVRNGRISRTYISYSVAYGGVSIDEIRELCSDKRVQAEFINNKFWRKKPIEEWDDHYLGLLVNASVAEVFNEEYLLLLYNVGKYVCEKRKMKKKRKIYTVAFMATIGGLIGLSIALYKKKGR